MEERAEERRRGTDGVEEKRRGGEEERRGGERGQF